MLTQMEAVASTEKVEEATTMTDPEDGAASNKIEKGAVTVEEEATSINEAVVVEVASARDEDGRRLPWRVEVQVVDRVEVVTTKEVGTEEVVSKAEGTARERNGAINNKRSKNPHKNGGGKMTNPKKK